MKKINVFAAIVGAALFVTSCGLGSTQTSTSTAQTNTTAQGVGQGLAGNLLTSVVGQGGQNVVGTLLGSLFGNMTSQNSIVGTWTYSQPKVTFKSESILAQVGSSIASSKIEQTLGTQLQKLGFQAGKTTMTFQSDGTCQMTRSGKTLPGTYSYDRQSGVMTISGTFGAMKVTPYVSVMGNEMYMLFEADKLLSVMGAISSVAKTSVLTNLLGNYNGLQLGWTMTRK